MSSSSTVQPSLIELDFGSAVSLAGDGKVLAVGAPGEDSIANGIDSEQDDNKGPMAVPRTCIDYFFHMDFFISDTNAKKLTSILGGRTYSSI